MSLSVAVIGAGRIGTVHAHTLAGRIPGAQLVAIADPRLNAARALAQETDVERVEATAEPLIADPAINAVVICSSTDSHAALVERAALAGKHIFCEKPLDLDLARIDRTLEVVAQAGIKLMLGFNRRFDPDFQRVASLVARGAIGQVELLRVTSRDPSPPPPEYVRVSGGLFLDMTIHDFDMARFLVGCEVQELYAAAAVRCDPAIGQAGDVDTAMITLRFTDGTRGSLRTAAARCTAMTSGWRSSAPSVACATPTTRRIPWCSPTPPASTIPCPSTSSCSATPRPTRQRCAPSSAASNKTNPLPSPAWTAGRRWCSPARPSSPCARTALCSRPRPLDPSQVQHGTQPDR